MASTHETLRWIDIWKTILFIVVALLAIPAVAAGLVAVVSFVWIGDPVAAIHFLIFSGALGGVAGICWRWMQRPYKNVLAINSAAIALGWIVATIVCAIPISTVCRHVAEPNETTVAMSQPINAWYESASSISSSGLTVASRSTDLPKAIQLWRSLNQWIGGVGLAVFALLLLEAAERGKSIYSAESRDWHPAQNVRSTVIRVLGVYTMLTAICGVLFAMAGMNAWETINHCMIITSTGGLTVVDDSFGSYSPTIQIIAAVFMLLGAISFGTIYLAGSGLFRDTSRLKKLFVRTDLRAMIVWTGSLLLIFLIQATIQSGNDKRDSVFNVISGISTCGVSSGRISEFSIMSIWLLIAAMFVGGSGDSTAGGFKINRAYWMLKCLIVQLQINLALVDPTTRPTWDGGELPRDEADQRTGRTLVMLFVFMTTLAAGFLALRLGYPSDVTSDRVLFQATSSLGAVGLSMDLTGPDRPTSVKIVEIALMIAGRIEIIALLLVVPVGIGRVKRTTSTSTASSESPNG